MLFFHLPSIDLSLTITDSSNFIIRVVPLCQCAVTLAGYNQNRDIVKIRYGPLKWRNLAQGAESQIWSQGGMPSKVTKNSKGCW